MTPIPIPRLHLVPHPGEMLKAFWGPASESVVRGNLFGPDLGLLVCSTDLGARLIGPRMGDLWHYSGTMGPLFGPTSATLAPQVPICGAGWRVAGHGVCCRPRG